jgi:hypothetical protein
MTPQKNDSSNNPSSLHGDQKSIELRVGDPSVEILDLLDNTWCGYMARYDGAYSESQEIPKKELRRLTGILKQMERDVVLVRCEFERRLNNGSS